MFDFWVFKPTNFITISIVIIFWLFVHDMLVSKHIIHKTSIEA